MNKLLAVVLLLTAQGHLAAADPVRVEGGLQALYLFQSVQDGLLLDEAGVGEPIHLTITDPKAVRLTSDGLQLVRPTVLRSQKPPVRLSQAIAQTREMTVEAWVTVRNLDQTGPARVVTFSKDPTHRNFTLGQDKDKWDVRLRTAESNSNGIPSLSSNAKAVGRDRTQVVFTHSRDGRTRLYLQGKKAAEHRKKATLTQWSDDFVLALGNEIGGGRPWIGTFHTVAIYARALRPNEIEQNFRAGPASSAERRSGQLTHNNFDSHIAPMLAKHCLECHDAATKKGGLDLSRRLAAFKGGENGPAIQKGSAQESLLWQYVESNDMPVDRPPLSEPEKQVLKKWLDDGAPWTADYIDPQLYSENPQVASHWIRRLTVPEYIATVRASAGVDIESEARRLLPADLRADGFSNTAYNLNVDLGHVEAYARLAEIIVSKMDVIQFARRFRKNQRLTDDNMRPLIADMGKWILRGPLTEDEVVSYRGISTTVASAGGGFKEAVHYILEAMFQSPRFLYRVEYQRGDGSRWPVSDYELASRMSYIIWGASPDSELFRLAEKGELHLPENVTAQTERMLKDSRTVERSKLFVSDWLDLNRLANLRPNVEKFPDWNDSLASDMREETLAFWEEVVWNQRRPLADLLNAQVTFLTPELARHYRLKPQADSFSKYDLRNEASRGGLLTHGSILTIGGDEASMVSRGLFVLHSLLRGTVKDPPPCVNTTPVPTKPGLTQRAIAEGRIANNACGGCHAKFEPLAFGLERFNGVGSYMTNDEHGNELREDGNILIPGEGQPRPYKTSAQLMDFLAASDRVRETLTWKIVQFSMGRPLTIADADEVTKIHQRAIKNGGTYTAVLKELIKSDLIQTTMTQPQLSSR